MPRFKKGNAMGARRPPGTPNESTLVFDEIGREGIEEVIRKVAGAARDGSMHAASNLLARAWPRGSGRPVMLDLPAVETAAGVVQAQAAVVAAMAAGTITRSAYASWRPGRRRARAWRRCWMSIASHGRRLDALAPTGRPRTLGELLEDSDEEKAVKALRAFARALVAAVPPPKEAGGGNRREPSVPAARHTQMPPAALPPPPAKPERLDPRELVTFEEAMRQPWVGLEPIVPSVPPSEQPRPSCHGRRAGSIRGAAAGFCSRLMQATSRSDGRYAPSTAPRRGNNDKTNFILVFG
jgi:hypothetical protein